MKKTDAINTQNSSNPSRRAMTPQSREHQLIAMAYDLAEKQLRDGTATSQVISHFLKLGSTSGRLEQDILTEQKKLIKAKTENLESVKKQEELYQNALEAMRKYSGHGGSDDDDN